MKLFRWNPKVTVIRTKPPEIKPQKSLGALVHKENSSLYSFYIIADEADRRPSE